MSAMAGDSLAQEKLCTAYLPQVVDVAKLYAGQGVYLEDLIGEGNVAVAMGVKMLGALEKPSEAEGMLGKMMMDAMEDYISEYAEESKRISTLPKNQPDCGCGKEAGGRIRQKGDGGGTGGGNEVFPEDY